MNPNPQANAGMPVRPSYKAWIIVFEYTEAIVFGYGTEQEARIAAQRAHPSGVIQSVEPITGPTVIFRELSNSQTPERPLPAGTMIDFMGEQAVVVEDKGGDTLVVDPVSGGGHQEWQWVFEGTVCKVVS